MKLLTYFFTILVVKMSYGQSQLYGSATDIGNPSNSICLLVDSCYSITNGGAYQTGAVWSSNVLDLNNSWSVEACVYLGANDAGADGLAFVLRGLTAAPISNWGGGLGYSTLTPSVSFEMDTYFNTGTAFGNTFVDIPEDHVSFHANGNTIPVINPVPLIPNGLNAEDNNFHRLIVSWDVSSLELKFIFDNNLRMMYSGNIINTYFNGVNDVLWGITGATGGSTNIQEVCFSNKDLTTQDIYMCKGDTMILPYSSYGFENPIINWNGSLSNGEIVNDSLYLYPDVSGDYIFTISESGGASSLSNSFNVIVSDLIVNAGMDTTICLGESYQLEATGGFIYDWFGGFNNLDQITPILGENIFYVQSFDTIGCFSNDSVIVNVISPAVINAGSDTLICHGDSLWMENILGFNWSSNDIDINTGTFKPDVGIHSIILSGLDSNLCFVTDTIIVQVKPLPVANFTFEILNGFDVQFMNTSSNSNYHFWSFDDSIDFVEEENPLHTFTFNEYYEAELIVSNEFGCSDTIRQLVEGLNVIDCYVPNTFTPDGDGVNDVFKPVCNNDVNVNLVIYNRWGELVFESTEVMFFWDGYIKQLGKKVQKGTYFWELKYFDHNSNIYHNKVGHVNVIY